MIQTLGQLIKQAKDDGVKPAVFGGKEYLTMVIRDGKLWLEPTTKEDLVQAKKVSPRKK